MTSDVTLWTQNNLTSQKMEYLRRLFLYRTETLYSCCNHHKVSRYFHCDIPSIFSLQYLSSGHDSQLSTQNVLKFLFTYWSVFLSNMISLLLICLCTISQSVCQLVCLLIFLPVRHYQLASQPPTQLANLFAVTA